MNNNERDIFDQLASASRRLVAGRKLPDGELPWAMIEQVRIDFRKWQESSGRTMEQIARDMGENYSIHKLRRFLAAAEGEPAMVDIESVARGLNQMMETDARRKRVAKPAGWVETDIARRMLLVIAKTIELGSIGLIYSDAGRGKSLTLKAAQAIFPGSILARVVSGASTPAGFITTIAEKLGLRGLKGSHAKLTWIISHLSESHRALLIDEAHRLTPAALEVVRDLHDECGLPVVLAGTHRVNEMCSDVDVFFGQFSSRVAIRYDVTETARQTGADPNAPASHPLHTVDEIRRLYQSDKVRFTGDGIGFLADLANTLGLGGLRLCTKLVMVAAQVAAAESVGDIDARLLRRVLRRLHGQEYVGAQIDRVMDAREAVA